MKLTRHALALTVAMSVTVGVLSPAIAGVPTDQLRERVEAVIRVLDDAALKAPEQAAERRAAIRAVAADIFDFGEITRRSLGRHWQAVTGAERDELVQLFTALLERSYIGKLERYAGERVAYLGEAVDADHATVRTRLVTRQGTEVPVDYRMHRRGERWLAYDVAIEGVSLVASYRTQFNRIIQASSAQGLVRALRERGE